LYLKEEINYKVRKDLSIYDEGIMESLFIEVVNKKDKNIIEDVIYRAPDSDTKRFLESTTQITEKIILRIKNATCLGTST